MAGYTVNNTNSQRPRLFHPWIIIACSLIGAGVYAWCIMRSSWARAGMFNLAGSFWYNVPIVVPLVAFLFDRAEHRRQLNALPFVLDLLVIGTALGRVIGNVPLVSGHTLFLTYAFISTRSKFVRITAIILLTHAAYFKYFVWHDFVTSTSGIILGSIAALLVLRFGQKTQTVSKVESDA